MFGNWFEKLRCRISDFAYEHTLWGIAIGAAACLYAYLRGRNAILSKIASRVGIK